MIFTVNKKVVSFVEVANFMILQFFLYLSTTDFKLYIFRYNYFLERSRACNRIGTQLSRNDWLHLHMASFDNSNFVASLVKSFISFELHRKSTNYVEWNFVLFRDNICNVQRSLQFNTLSSKYLLWSCHLYMGRKCAFCYVQLYINLHIGELTVVALISRQEKLMHQKLIHFFLMMLLCGSYLEVHHRLKLCLLVLTTL